MMHAKQFIIMHQWHEKSHNFASSLLAFRLVFIGYFTFYKY